MYALKLLNTDMINDPFKLAFKVLNFFHKIIMSVKLEDMDTKLGVWGNNSNGQVAIDSPGELIISVPKLLSFRIDIRDISCGFKHTLFRSVEGQLYVTGDNSKFQLGIDSRVKRRVSPTAVNFENPDDKVLLASAQGYFNVVYTEFGNVYTWGDNSSG